MFLEKEMVHGNYYQQNLKHFVKAVLISVLKFAKKGYALSYLVRLNWILETSNTSTKSNCTTAKLFSYKIKFIFFLSNLIILYIFIPHVFSKYSMTNSVITYLFIICVTFD